MELLGRILGLTATLIMALIFLLIVGLAAANGLLDDLGRVAVGIFTIPIKVADALINLAGQVDLSGGGSPPTTTTGP